MGRPRLFAMGWANLAVLPCLGKTAQKRRYVRYRRRRRMLVISGLRKTGQYVLSGADLFTTAESLAVRPYGNIVGEASGNKIT